MISLHCNKLLSSGFSLTIIFIAFFQLMNLVSAAPMDGGYGGDGSYDGGYDGGYDGSYDGGYDGGYDGSYGGSGNDGSYSSDGSYNTNDGSYDGCYGPCGGGAPTLSGYVYEDLDQSTTYNNGDNGISDTKFGEPMIVQVIRPAYTIPAYNTGGYCEPSSFDENGNPTGETCYPLVNHPAVSYPDTLIGQGATDAGGHYSISNIPGGQTYRVHHTKEPLPSGWVRTTPNDVLLVINRNMRQSFGLRNTSFAQNLPQASCIGTNPNIHISWDSLSSAVNYKIIYIEPSDSSIRETGPLPTTPQTYEFSPSTTPLTLGGQYTFVIAALNASGAAIAYSDDKWSSEKFGTYTPYRDDCASNPPPGSPPPTSTAPVVNLWINSIQNGTVPYIEISQNSPQPSLTWQVSNTPNNSCLASAAFTDGSPAPANINAVWSGVKGPPPIAPATGGPVAIPTNTSGKYLFSLICTNSAGTTSATIQLNVNQYPPAYFQTTGGDVHSNETIYISQ